MVRKKRPARLNKRRKARRQKAVFVRTAALIFLVAVFAGLVFLGIKLIDGIKDILPDKKKSEAAVIEAEEAEEYDGENIITINKDGSLTETSTEEFDTSEYDPEGLKAMIKETIAEYNGSGEEKISLKSVDVKKGIARAVIYYSSAKDYAKYNDKTFDIGDVHDLDITGVTLADDRNTVLTHDGIEKIKGKYVLLNDNTVVSVPKSILFVSRNVRKTSGKSAEVRKAGIDSVIIFK